MAAVNLKKIIQEMVMPELQEIKMGESTIKVEIKRLDEKIDSLRNEFSVRLQSLEREITRTIDIHERLPAVEAKLGL